MSLARRVRTWRLRLRSLTHRNVVDGELHRELVFHFEQLVAEKIAQGLTVEAAHQAAHRALGNVAVLEEVCRDERRVNWAHDLRQDLKYAVRSLRKQPGLLIVAVTSLALGIGANAAVLGAFDTLFVQGLPVAHAERLAAIQSAPLDNPSQTGGLSLREYAAIRDRSQLFETIDASIRVTSDLTADGGAPPERILGQTVTSGWLSSLGIAPLMGQVFPDASAQSDEAASVVVLSHGFWQRHFGSDPDVLRRQVRLQGSPRQIVGVMPDSFRYQDADVDYWTPLTVGPQPDPGSRLFTVRARLKPGVSLIQAQAELQRVAARLAIERPDLNKGWGFQIRPLNDVLFGWTRQPLAMFEAAAALVLLIGCANVAALLLSRASIRRRELALRASLGAGRGRLIRQSLVESMLLALGGGVLGLLVTLVGQSALVAMSGPPSAVPLSAIGFNGRVFVLLALLSLASGLACGVVPAIRGSNPDPARALREPGPGIGVRTSRTMARGLLVSAQLALALILLIGSGLLLNSFVRLLQRDLHVDSSGLVRLDYTVPALGYVQRIGTYEGFPYFEITHPPSQMLQRVLDQLRAVPGTESVAGISAPPVDAFVLTTPGVTIEPPGHTAANPAYFLVTPNLFKTLRTPLLRGRDFTDQDTVDAPWVAVVNETCARQFWAGADPIGQRLTLDTVPEEQPRRVIGVVADIPTRHAEPPVPVIYASYLQQPTRYRAPWANLFGTMTFMMRASGDAAGVIRAARQAVARIDPERPLVNVSTVDAHMRNANGRFRDSVFLVSVLAVVATLLAAIGTYGVMAYSVSQHTREIGIRRAMGAGSREIMAFVVRRAVLFVGLGVFSGIAGALLFTRVLASQLWGITPTDPVTFVTVTLLLIGVAALACVVPARRALAVDPTVALKTE